LTIMGWILVVHTDVEVL